MPKVPRLVVALFLAAAVAWLGFRAVRAFDTDRHTAQAAAVLAAPDTVTYDLTPVLADGQGTPKPRDPGAPEREGSPAAGGVPWAVHSPADGRFSYRPGTWLSVVDLEGLEPVAGDERYLVFLRNWAGWTLGGRAAAPHRLRGGGDQGGRRRHQHPPRPAGAAVVRRLHRPTPGAPVRLRRRRLSRRRFWFTAAKQTSNRAANAGC